ncbi:DUF2442 domain-containing protein [Pseudopedobacter beijingensis]|uniref:DUF2442 domain-containing protein n=1 Tax=Pseudopedobacter beijingensis TaxID=1207056 RepID=A0ABW4II04_9SPHI
MGIVSTRRKDQELKVTFNDDTLVIELEDGKETAFPLLWHPQLRNASDEEKNQWELSQDGKKIVWKNLNVEIAI